MASRPQSLKRLLSNGHHFQQFATAISQQEQLLGIVRAALAAPLDRHCRWAGLKDDGELVVLVDGSAWLTRLRFSAPSLRARLNGDAGLAVRRITGRVVGPEHRPVNPRRPQAKLSKENANLVRQTAEHIQDSALRRALLRLSRHAGP